MPKTKISEFSSTPSANTDIDGINTGEGMLPSDVNNAIRELMSQLKNQQAGLDGDNFTVGGNLAVTGTTTLATSTNGVLKATSGAVAAAVAGTDYQAPLVSGTNIKTVNSTSLLGSGNVAVQEVLVSGTNLKTVNSTSLLGSGNVAVQEVLVSGTNIKTVGGTSILGSGDIPVGTGDVTLTGTQTLTNKRITSRVVTATSASSLTPDVSAADQYNYTALAAGLTINAPTGTPVDGDKLVFRLLDNGTSRSLSWNATYTAIGVTLPTATTINKTTYVGCIYNANNTRWDVIAVTTQA